MSMGGRRNLGRTEGWIYFIGCPEPMSIKIGFTTKEPIERLKQLQTGNPMQLILLGWYPGTIEEERRLHEKLRDYRMQGEWFRINPAMNDLLKGPMTLLTINNQLSGHSPPLGEECSCG